LHSYRLDEFDICNTITKRQITWVIYTRANVIVSCPLFLPAFILFGKRATPYFVALIQPSLIGDYLTGAGIQLLWPIASYWYGLGVEIISQTNIFTEWILFLTSIAIMLKTKDARLPFQRHPSNLTISIPVLTVLLPTFLSFPFTSMIPEFFEINKNPFSVYVCINQ